MHKTTASTLYWEKMDVESIPWDTVCIDLLIGPYTVIDQNGDDRILNAMTFVDPETGWFEIAEIPDKTSARISQIFNNTWLSDYPRPRQVIFDNGNEFKKYFLPLIRDFSTKILLKQLRIFKPIVYWREFVKS